MSNKKYNSFFASNVPQNSVLTEPLPRPKYDFAVAFPDPDHFPMGDLHESLGEALKDQGRDLVFYPHPQGLLEFRELVCEKIKENRGIDVGPQNVIITAGSGQSINLITQLFINPGDTIVSEKFTYTGALRVFERFGAKMAGVEMDDEGMLPEYLENKLIELKNNGISPKFIYTIPTFQNPVGTDMSFERKKEILAISQKYQIPLFEDDCYADLRFEGENHPAIASLKGSDNVVYSGSFSKILAPGLRLGWIVAPDTFLPYLMAVNPGTPPSQFTILSALYFLKKNMEDHIAGLCNMFRGKRDCMLGAIGEFMGSEVEIIAPKGGLYLWLKFPENVDLEPILPIAREKGVIFGLGNTFSTEGKANNFIRLCYGYHNLEDTVSGIELLANIFREQGLLKS